MNRLKLGVDLGVLGLPLRRGLEQARRLQVAGIQIDAAGDLAPKQLSQTGRRELVHLLKGHNLELAALNCPLRHGLGTADGLEERIDHVRRVLTLSYDLGARRVVIQPGKVPAQADGGDEPRRSLDGHLLTESLLALGQHGDRTGTVLALETGLDSGQALSEFLDCFDTGGLGVALDPANLLLSGYDPYDHALALRNRIVYAQAKDARPASASRAGQEVPLGHGELDWMRLLAVLEDIDYHGWLTVKRDSGSNRLADITAGVHFLRRFVSAEPV